MKNFSRIETMDDVRIAIGTSKTFAEELFKIIDGDKEEFADERASGEGDGWIPTVEDIIQKELDGDGFFNWIIDNNGNAYELEVVYESGHNYTFLMRIDGDEGITKAAGWYTGKPNEADNMNYYEL